MDNLANFFMQGMDSLNFWLWKIVALGLFMLGLIGTHPLAFNEEATLIHRGFVLLRRVVLIGLLFLIFLVPIVFYIAYSGLVDTAFGSSQFITWYGSLFKYYSRLLIAAYLAAFLIRTSVIRYLLPRWSNFKRNYRVHLTSDKLSDIRQEKSKYKHKLFNPQDYYKKDHIFFRVKFERRTSLYCFE